MLPGSLVGVAARNLSIMCISHAAWPIECGFASSIMNISWAAWAVDPGLLGAS